MNELKNLSIYQKMSFQLCQLSDKLQRLNWGTSKFVTCGECFMTNKSNVQCCLCDVMLKSFDFKNAHALMGGPEENVEEHISKIHYLCRNCKKQCTICR